MLGNAIKTETREISCSDGQILSYTLERKKVKNINLRVHPNGTISVSAPVYSSLNFVDEFVIAKSSYIYKAQACFKEKRKWEINEKRYLSGESFYLLGRQLRLMVKKSNENHIDDDGVYLTLYCKNPDDFSLKERLIKKFFIEQCFECFSFLLKKNYPLFQKYGVSFPSLKIRIMNSRWGSCIPSKNQITLNTKLIHFSERCIEYVVIHEFCHFRHPNHSKDFYTLMTVLMPDWKERKWELDNTVLI